MTGASPRRHTGAAQGGRGAPRGALVAVVVIALAVGGVRVGAARAAEVPPAIVLDLREGIGVASAPAPAPGASTGVGEPIAVGDSASISPGARAESLEGVRVADAAAVSLGAREDLGEGVRVSDLTTTKLGIHLQITEAVGVGDETDVALSIVNTAPTVTAGSAQTASEGASTSIALGGFTDVGDAGPWTVTVDWGDGTPATTSTVVAPGPLTGGHTYANGPSTHTVRVSVTDLSGLTGEAMFSVSVVNSPPTLAPPTLDRASIDEDGAVTLAGSISDPGLLDTQTVVIDWGDGGAPTTLVLAAGTFTFSASHRYVDDDPTGTPSDTYTIGITATDRDGGSAAVSTPVTVRNVAPVLGAITAPATPQPVGTAVSVSAPFSDVGTADTHSGTWDWGDGTTSAATISETSGAGTAGGTHVYTRAGTFTVTMTLVDDDGGRTTASVSSLIVYDRDAGFVTAGGSFASPAGAIASDPSRSGRATFGLEVRYLKGSTVPTGQTQLQLPGAMRFHSTTHLWLVVSGGRAQYAGTGRIDGTGNYGLLVTLIDGGPGGGGDRIRVKIWDRATGAVVYDTQRGSADGAAPATVVSGSVTVHR